MIRSKFAIALILATCLAGGVTVLAATTRATQDPQAPESSPKPAPAKVKLIGCLARDSMLASAFATTAMDVTPFVLTAIDADSLKSAGAATSTDVAGVAAVRLHFHDEFEFLDRMSHVVQVEGRFISDGPRGSVLTTQGVISPPPVFLVTSVHTVQSHCQ